MKKILLYIVLGGTLLLSGCGSYNEKDVIKKIEDKIESASSYYVTGEMEIVNNEDIYTYDVKVAYQKDDNYRIELVNTTNNHEQIILRNEDGVYVVTPSLNKSFKFQSDWPYNNSQIYLLTSLLDDMSEKDGRSFVKKDDGYEIKTKVNYPNNENLVSQVICLSKKLVIKEVRVLDEDDNTQIKMVYNKIKYNKEFDEDYFELNSIISVEDASEKEIDEGENPNTSEQNTKEESSSDNNVTKENSQETETNIKEDDALESNTKEESTEETATIEDIIYPMYLPSNTYLKGQEKLNTDTGERLILTFEGDNPFTLVEETVTYSKEHEIIPTYGDLELLLDSIAVVNDNSVNWISNGIEYYLVSDTIGTSKLLDVARSISVLPVSK